MSENGHQTRGHDLRPGDVIRTGVPFSPWYGQIDSLEPHGTFDRWQVANFHNARPMSIDPDAWFYVKERQR